MENYPSFNQIIQDSIINNWDLDALTDYKGATLQFHDVARKIEKLHILFENCGVVKGDKIALCGRNSSQWAVAFLATLTYGAVAVPILHEFMAEQIHNIVNHSDAKLLFVGDHVATQIDPMQMPHLEGIINNPDYSLMVSRTDKLTYAREHLNELYGKKFPKYFRKEHVHYYIEQNGDELALINYTSGTTGFSKGVMIPYRALWSNYDFAEHVLGKIIGRGDRIISILPMAHMYGMAFEFVFEFLHGCHTYYLNRIPSPAIIAQAFADIKPKIIIAVPLVIEKIIRKKVFPKIQNNRMRLLLSMPVISKKVREKICQEVVKAFGGELYEVIIGGAAFNQEVEAFLKRIEFPYTVGYGATECAPIICYRDWHTFAQGSCGQAGSFLGEYQAGGVIVVLNLDEPQKPCVGAFPCTGMHGGKMFLRSACEGVAFPRQVSVRPAAPEDLDELRACLEEYCGVFGLDPEAVLDAPFTVVTPDTSNPYRQMYVQN